MSPVLRPRPKTLELDGPSLTQNALVANVIMLLLKPGFLPFGVTLLYTHSRNHTLVFMFHESRRILKFGGNSINPILTLAAPSQSDLPDVL